MQRYGHGAHELELLAEFPGKRVPIASVGAEWRMSRKAILPIFTAKAFTDHVCHAIHRVVPVTRELLRDASRKGTTIDWNDLAARMTLSILTLSSMDFDPGSITPDVSCLQVKQSLAEAIAVLNQSSSRRLFNPFWRWTELLTGERVRFNRARAHVRGLVDSLIKTRRAQLADRTDPVTNDWLSKLLEDKNFDDPIFLRDILVVLLFAGVDNTQNSFAWSLYSLTQAPYWVGRMRDEALKNRKAGHEVQYEDLTIYHIHLAVFYETIRLWPGIPKNGRVALCDDVLPAVPTQGLPEVHLKKGDFILWSDYNIMRDEAVWGPNANSFNPGRHLDGDGRFVRPTAPRFNGFGGGPRMCPAMQLVAYKFVASWAGILPYFDFLPSTHDPGTGRRVEPPRLAEAFTAAMATPFLVTVKALEETEL
ncbi:cytochrome P450 [Pilatotrama ljubarskyi]|nr:cytochrome P450 [Pilatotrama ljubarskyi]